MVVQATTQARTFCCMPGKLSAGVYFPPKQSFSRSLRSHGSTVLSSKQYHLPPPPSLPCASGCRSCGHEVQGLAAQLSLQTNSSQSREHTVMSLMSLGQNYPVWHGVCLHFDGKTEI